MLLHTESPIRIRPATYRGSPMYSVDLSFRRLMLAANCLQMHGSVTMSIERFHEKSNLFPEQDHISSVIIERRDDTGADISQFEGPQMSVRKWPFGLPDEWAIAPLYYGGGAPVPYDLINMGHVAYRLVIPFIKTNPIVSGAYRLVVCGGTNLGDHVFMPEGCRLADKYRTSVLFLSPPIASFSPANMGPVPPVHRAPSKPALFPYTGREEHPECAIFHSLLTVKGGVF